ncbi:MAG: hypothetical protein KF819_30225 [Labilithrix sp.]|nr:hypothetical protein [Labilithrix sp.]
MGHLIVGVLLLGSGIAVTVSSEAVIAYGAIVVGAIEIGRGAFILLRGSGASDSERRSGRD